MMRRTAWIAVAAVLVGCDDGEPQITMVERKKQFVADQMWQWKDARGLPVEIHGTPFPLTSDNVLAKALLQPSTATGDLAFYAAPTGSWKSGHSRRLVLHFNPQGDPSPYRDCKLDKEANTNQPPNSGISVHVTFCQMDQWIAHANLVVPGMKKGDLEAFGLAMQQVILTIFAAKPIP